MPILSLSIGYLSLFLGSLSSGRIRVPVRGGLIVDSVRRILSVITSLVLLGCMVATFKTEFFQISYFMRFAALILRSLLVFRTSQIVYFYVAFELSLIPITLIIMG